MKATWRLNVGASQCSQEAASNNTSLLAMNEFQLIFVGKAMCHKVGKVRDLRLFHT